MAGGEGGEPSAARLVDERVTLVDMSNGSCKHGGTAQKQDHQIDECK
jgi:hypothetical protein